MEFHSLKDVLQEQLEDLHSAETQLIAALPKMAQAAHHDQLREAFENHLEETKGHLKRVKEALSEIGVGTPTEVCMGMKGLITEGEEMIQTEGDPNVKDVALIGAMPERKPPSLVEARALAPRRQLFLGAGGYAEHHDARDDKPDQRASHGRLSSRGQAVPV